MVSNPDFLNDAGIPEKWKPTAAEPVPVVQCTAIARSTGAQCKRFSLRGATVCVKHGARLPNVQQHAAAVVEAARLRLIGLADEAIDIVYDLALNSTADQVRLGAAKDLLDRANVKGVEMVAINLSDGQETAADRTRRTLDDVVTRLEAAKAREKAAKEAEDIVDAEVVEDLPDDE